MHLADRHPSRPFLLAHSLFNDWPKWPLAAVLAVWLHTPERIPRVVSAQAAQLLVSPDHLLFAYSIFRGWSHRRPFNFQKEPPSTTIPLLTCYLFFSRATHPRLLPEPIGSRASTRASTRACPSVAIRTAHGACEWARCLPDDHGIQHLLLVLSCFSVSKNSPQHGPWGRTLRQRKPLSLS